MGRQQIDSITSKFMEAFKAFEGLRLKPCSDNQLTQVQVDDNEVGPRSRLKENDESALSWKSDSRKCAVSCSVEMENKPAHIYVLPSNAEEHPGTHPGMRGTL